MTEFDEESPRPNCRTEFPDVLFLQRRVSPLVDGVDIATYLDKLDVPIL